jgi:NAD(P)-dependent dehydrogenase (short-subunit alcohol dehydrogenase family)
VDELRRDGGVARAVVADLSSLAEVAGLGKSVCEQCESLDLLVNNAGVGFGRPGAARQLSQDGYELRLAVNYLAPVMLVGLLTGMLSKAVDAQVVNVGSAGQEPLDFADPQLARGYDGTRAYTRSKFALATYTVAVAEHLHDKGIRTNCVHPANYMDTAMVKDAGVPAWTSVDDGLRSVQDLIDSNGVWGRYFDGRCEAKAHPQAYQADIQQRLASLTTSLIGEQG